MSCKTPNKQTEDTDAAEDRHVLNFKIRFILGCQDMWEQQQTPYNEGVRSFKSFISENMGLGFFSRETMLFLGNCFLMSFYRSSREATGQHLTTLWDGAK